MGYICTAASELRLTEGVRRGLTESHRPPNFLRLSNGRLGIPCRLPHFRYSNGSEQSHHLAKERKGACISSMPQDQFFENLTVFSLRYCSPDLKTCNLHRLEIGNSYTKESGAE